VRVCNNSNGDDDDDDDDDGDDVTSDLCFLCCMFMVLGQFCHGDSLG